MNKNKYNIKKACYQGILLCGVSASFCSAGFSSAQDLMIDILCGGAEAGARAIGNLAGNNPGDTTNNAQATDDNPQAVVPTINAQNSNINGTQSVTNLRFSCFNSIYNSIFRRTPRITENSVQNEDIGNTNDTAVEIVRTTVAEINRIQQILSPTAHNTINNSN